MTKVVDQNGLTYYTTKVKAITDNIQTQVDGKQDTLVSGTNIKTINNTSILGSGDITIQSAPPLDQVTINQNTNNQLQAIGVIDNNSNAIKTWTGTKAEYDAIVTKDSNTLYNVKGDNEAVAYNAYTKTETNALLDTKLGKNQITNCILEDPQNIKLELNNGTLTLKAGSVVCVPNGFEEDGVTPKFDEVTIASDKSRLGITNRTAMTIYAPDGISNTVLSLPPAYCYSGATAPTSFYGQGYAIWYDTTNNLIKWTNTYGSTWNANGNSFPYGIQTETTSGYTSLNQTFQSIGYIGSTVFVRKGLKGLAPDGRNADGSLKYEEVSITSNCVTDTITVASMPNVYMNANTSHGIEGNGARTYDIQNNFILNNGVRKTFCEVAKFSTDSDAKITNFQPYTAVSINSMCDGQWVYKTYDLYSGTFTEGQTVTYDLSSYLPKDNCIYEVIFICFIRTSGTADTSVGAAIHSSVIQANIRVCRCLTRTASSTTASGNAIIPIGLDRTLTYYNQDSTGTSGNCGLSVYGYRRLGTNS